MCMDSTVNFREKQNSQCTIIEEHYFYELKFVQLEKIPVLYLAK